MSSTRSRALTCAVLWFCVTAQGLSAVSPAVPVPSALEPAATGGLATLDLALAKLAVHARVLIVGAHPDDEDNSLLTYVVRVLGGEAAYLSLSRGEGGQNLVGPELGIGLGVIRTGELVAARGIDGGRQFFTRAYDFGYTRSLDETLERWPREILEEDAVRVVRRFMPQVVVAIFPPDERARHGQHQASAVVAAGLLDLAGLPDRFPDLTTAGLDPWRPDALYRRTWWAPEEATLWLPLDGLEPLSGKSTRQIAAASRSMHRSQDMGRVQEIGSRQASFAWVAGGEGPGGGDLFSGIDTHLAAMVAGLPEGEARATMSAALDRVEGLAREARRALTPADPSAVTPRLREILGHLVEIREMLRGVTDSRSARPAGELLEEKIEIAEVALAAASGLVVDAVADREEVALGEEILAAAKVWNAGGGTAVVERIEITAAPGWRPVRSEAPEISSALDARSDTGTPLGEPAGPPGPGAADGPTALAPGQLGEWRYRVEVAHDAEPTLPYFLAGPLLGDLYDWGSTPAAVRGEPYQAPPLVARFTIDVEGVPITLEREVVFRYGDQAFGERRRPVRAVPALQVGVAPELLVWPVSEAGIRQVEVSISSSSAEPVQGTLRAVPPEGWPEVAPVPFSIDRPRGRQTVRLPIRAPEPLAPGSYAIRFEALRDDGTRYDTSMPLLDYPHIRPAAMAKRATVAVRAVDLALPELGRIGYVRGASDRVPEALVEIGVPVEILDEHALVDGELAGFDAIVVGSRAYETDPALERANARLLEYVREGGTLIVQYQQYQFVRGGFPPYELEIARPHDRVTDETSPVSVLEPGHAVFNVPNEIGTADWEDWVQERGLYFAASWADDYLPLLALQDPGQPELRGGLLVAGLGRGIYVYTGLSFFRELPAGVPGAYRLFANLLALGRETPGEAAP